MNTAAIHHEAREPWAYRTESGDLRVVLRAARGDLQAVTVTYGDRYQGVETERHLQLKRSGHDRQHDYWTAVLRLATRRFRYAFLVDDGCFRLWYGEGGCFEARPESHQTAGYFHVPYLHDDASIDPPEWAADAVFYQIFPDRFDNADETNDPECTARWGDPPTATSVFGGDLAGITRRLDYLARLGASCLYLTPVFLAPSNHKYDTYDYYHLDPRLGDESAARRLMHEAHARGIRVVLDAVFNHCGSGFPPFRDVMAKGAESRYARWFHCASLPLTTRPKPNYETFAHCHAGMPKLATGNPEVREYVIGAAEHWTHRLDIDGWRLDVADEVHPELWREFRRRIRAIRPDALLAGEIAHEAGAWLTGDQLDCVMNYPFRDACVQFFARREMGASHFADALTGLRFRYRDQVNRAQLNLLGSHDTPRFLTLCGEDRQRLRLAALFQFTYIGAPYIYYGDEIGLTGGDDPDCRKCMLWDPAAQDRGLLTHFSTLARLRRDHRVLRRGELAFLDDAALAGTLGAPDAPGTALNSSLPGVLSFLRWDEASAALVTLNNGDVPVELGSGALLAAARSCLGNGVRLDEPVVIWPDVTGGTAARASGAGGPMTRESETRGPLQPGEGRVYLAARIAPRDVPPQPANGMGAGSQPS